MDGASAIPQVDLILRDVHVFGRSTPNALRHTFASLLILAGKNPLYVSRQMGHHSPGFTRTVYGHLMEELPRR